jgi:acyl-CoA thioesterase-2
MAFLLERLRLEPLAQDRFVGSAAPAPHGRLFGGHVAAQALLAAGRTTDGLLPHSLHAYFLRPGSASEPIEHEVTRARDGRSFSTRSVTSRQKGEVIFTLQCSFHRPEQGPEHQIEMPDVPPPEQCMELEEYLKQRRSADTKNTRSAFALRPIEVRLVEPPAPTDAQARTTVQRVWMRTRGALPDDPLLRTCVAVWASDHTLLGAMRRPHGGGPGFGRRELMSASLDHSVWLHREVRIDDWLLYDQVSPLTFGARGLSQGRYYTREGVLVASMCQEGLLRRITEPSKD